jgi:hypothetical protein
MLVDLAQRLEKRGVRVSLNHAHQIALAASYKGKAVAVETDAVLAQGSLRESLRLRPELLRRLGWHYIRIHAFELFADPEAVATRIAALIGIDPIEDEIATGAIEIVTEEPALQIAVDVVAAEQVEHEHILHTTVTETVTETHIIDTYVTDTAVIEEDVTMTVSETNVESEILTAPIELPLQDDDRPASS